MQRTLRGSGRWLAQLIERSFYRRDDHYVWFTEYLAGNGLQGVVRLVAATVAPVAAIVSAVFVFSEDGPSGPIGSGLIWCGALGFALSGTIWMRSWPSPSASRVFAVMMIVSLAAVSLSAASPLASLIGCVAFIGINTYVAALHPIHLLACAMAVPVCVSIVEGVRLWTAGHHLLAVIDPGLIAGMNILIPMLASVCVGAFGFDLLRADRDPLTGLLNRGGFWEKTRGLMASPPAHHSHLIVTVVDLDKFKQINDTQGHAAGDRVLVAVAEALRLQAADAVIARIGGEEFALAVTTASADPGSLPTRLCGAIAGLPERVTGSIGTASIGLAGLDGRDHATVIDDLVVKADDAMYRAKRHGGNQHRHHEEPSFSQWTGAHFDDAPRGRPPA